ncbi:hypothetical protein GCM10027575_69210 [Phytohabitans suffuscus]
MQGMAGGAEARAQRGGVAAEIAWFVLVGGVIVDGGCPSGASTILRKRSVGRQEVASRGDHCGWIRTLGSDGVGSSALGLVGLSMLWAALSAGLSGHRGG